MTSQTAETGQAPASAAKASAGEGAPRKTPDERNQAEDFLRGLSRTLMLRMYVLALIAGLIVGLIVVLFRIALETIQFLGFGARDERLTEAIAALPWWQVMGVPILGGAIVGLLLVFVLRRERPMGIADLINTVALHDGKTPLKDTLVSGLISVISLGAGASAGREGPVVHLGGGLVSFMAKTLKVDPPEARLLVACGAAAAVSASFNAPIAGVLFALEVVLRHYALRAFAPIVIASAAAAVLSRAMIGETAAFVVPPHAMVGGFDFVIVALLGMAAGAMAASFIKTLEISDKLAQRAPLPLWLRPIIGGVLLGLIGLAAPEVLGVGYEATDAALLGEYAWTALAFLIAMKILATAVTLASRFGGGVFAPSLYLGAMLGGLVGLLVQAYFPGEAAAYGFFALVGLGAAAAAVLGAPLSTTLIVFELTGGFDLGIALLIACSVATVTNQNLVGHSFFQGQLKRRGVDLSKGTYAAPLHRIKVRDFMAPYSAPKDNDVSKTYDLSDKSAPRLYTDTPLKRALELLTAKQPSLPVVTRKAPTEVVGVAYLWDALKVYNDALVELNIEEHR